METAKDSELRAMTQDEREIHLQLINAITVLSNSTFPIFASSTSLAD
jgi:hypothetical protein